MPIVAVIGPTACGKTRRAVQLAEALNAEIISADSRQVYRGMDIGTGKDLDEYHGIPYHLIDICEAGEKYNLHRFIHDAGNAIADIEGRGKRVVVCGGTGMYVENLLAGIKLPEVPANPSLRKSLESCSLEELTAILSRYRRLHNTTDTDTCQRAVRAIEIEEWYRAHPEEASMTERQSATPLNSVIIGLDIPRDKRRQRISSRLKQRLEEGMVDEARRLLKNGLTHEDLMYYGLEYKFLSLFLQGQIDIDEMTLRLETAIHQFAKRQMTWLRGMERRGFSIHWLPFDMPDHEFLNAVKSLSGL